ncbi:MAG: NAD(P)/FAD-dependent oxidoreductase [Arenicellaceae bacterium]|nr:NAD(P)/FAD-dependent oxidoreductase [Arenicellaceae bacterium]
MKNYDVIILGGGASGLMCAFYAGNKNLNVLVLEKNQKAGMKILISGGGRCNFTNLSADPREHYISQNPHFCISAMRRYSPSNFIELVEKHGVAYHEKILGQLFCDDSSKQIQAMLLEECERVGVDIRLNSRVRNVVKRSGSFNVELDGASFSASKVVVACGGLSLPKIASDLAYSIANHFDLQLVPPRAGLVPLTWNSGDKPFFESLSGISFTGQVSCNGYSFDGGVLFTHRGLSGPAILQISSYWREGDSIFINCLPNNNVLDWLLEQRETKPQNRLSTLLRNQLPRRFVDKVAGKWFEDTKIGSYSPKQLNKVTECFANWEFRPGGSEGYRTAEVTLGGISTDELSSQTFECTKVPGLYAIGEAVDVTGWLGGYNFQWAWASAYCCAKHL